MAFNNTSGVVNPNVVDLAFNDPDDNISQPAYDFNGKQIDNLKQSELNELYKKYSFSNFTRMTKDKFLSLPNGTKADLQRKFIYSCYNNYTQVNNTINVEQNLYGPNTNKLGTVERLTSNDIVPSSNWDDAGSVMLREMSNYTPVVVFGAVKITVNESEEPATYVNCMILGQIQEIDLEVYEPFEGEEIYEFYRPVLDENNFNKVVALAKCNGRLVDCFSDELLYNNGYGESESAKIIPKMFRMSATTQMKFALDEHLKNKPNEPFTQIFFVNPKSDPRHQHNKAKKFKEQQVTRYTAVKPNTYGLKLLREECDSDEMSLEELFELSQTIDDNENSDRLRVNYSNLIKLIINNVLKHSKHLLRVPPQKKRYPPQKKRGIPKKRWFR